MSSFGGVLGGGSGDRGLRLNLADTLRLAWADPELRQRLIFVLGVFAIYAFGVHVPVPVPGVSPDEFERLVADNALFQLLNTFGGGALRRISVFALGLNPYITSSIIMQIASAAIPKLKQEMKEGGEYARRQQNRRTRALCLALCFFQGWGLLTIMQSALGQQSVLSKLAIVVFWTAGAMFLLWLGEQVSEKGIGNGVSLMIFAGIIISLPNLVNIVANAALDGTITWFQVGLLAIIFLATTWFIVMFTISQRRIPIQHMRRQMGTKVLGGSTSYLPFSLNLAGVIPIIFAISLVYMPAQFATMFPPNSPLHEFFGGLSQFLSPDFRTLQGWIGCLFYSGLIFFFTYFYTALQYNVDDIADNLKRGGSFIPGVRPGKQTRDFLDGVISRITLVGAMFLAIVALSQYLVPAIIPISSLGLLFGTSLLIMVSVALETMRQIEANLLMKQYGM